MTAPNKSNTVDQVYLNIKPVFDDKEYQQNLKDKLQSFKKIENQKTDFLKKEVMKRDKEEKNLDKKTQKSITKNREKEQKKRSFASGINTGIGMVSSSGGVFGAAGQVIGGIGGALAGGAGGAVAGASIFGAVGTFFDNLIGGVKKTFSFIDGKVRGLYDSNKEFTLSEVELIDNLTTNAERMGVSSGKMASMVLAFKKAGIQEQDIFNAIGKFRTRFEGFTPEQQKELGGNYYEGFLTALERIARDEEQGQTAGSQLLGEDLIVKYSELLNEARKKGGIRGFMERVGFSAQEIQEITKTLNQKSGSIDEYEGVQADMLKSQLMSSGSDFDKSLKGIGSVNQEEQRQQLKIRGQAAQISDYILATMKANNSLTNAIVDKTVPAIQTLTTGINKLTNAIKDDYPSTNKIQVSKEVRQDAFGGDNLTKNYKSAYAKYDIDDNE